MQLDKFKMMVPKTFFLLLSLGIVGGYLPINLFGHVMLTDAEARVAARGPRGGAVAAGPRGMAAVGPRGGAVAATPRSYVHGGSVVAGPRRAYVEGPRGGQAYVGPRGGAVRGPYGGTAVVRTLPVGARVVAVAGLTYYVASGVYYRPVYEGSTVVYQQVEDPQAQ